MREENYTSFESWQDKKFFGFRYPADWTLRENLDLEKGHREFFIICPEASPLTNLFFGLWLSWKTEQTAEKAAEDLFQNYRKGFKAVELNHTSKDVDGNSAIEIEFSFDMRLPLNSVDAKLTKIHARHIFIKRGEQLFELRFTPIEEDYNKWVHCFDIFANSFCLSWVSWKPKHHVLPEYS